MEPVTLAGRTTGDGAFIDPFVATEKVVTIGVHTTIQSHVFICELVPQVITALSAISSTAWSSSAADVATDAGLARLFLHHIVGAPSCAWCRLLMLLR